MPTIEMTLHKDYVPDWDTWCGIRELAQNCVDSEKEFGATASIWYRKNSGTLVFKNEGITIPREALLIGYTTKKENDNLSGQFGEGLNLGILALVREGLTITIRNGKEVWKPILEKSDKFSADVLKMRITKGQKDYHGVQVEVRRITEDDWEMFKKCLLFLTPPKEGEVINTSRGSILKGEEYRGMVFVRSIFVERMPNIHYGYDMDRLKIDRDRKMVDRWDAGWAMSQMWAEASDKKQIETSVLYSMLEAETDEVKELHYQSHYRAADNITEEFVRKYGEETVPVKTLAESKEIEHFGKKAVVVSKSLSKVLETKLGTYESIKHKLAERSITLHAWGSLTAEEQHNVDLAIQMVNQVSKLSIGDIDVVDFADDNTLGQRKEDRILVSRSILTDLPQLLATVAHEHQHQAGNDAEWSFHYSVEELLAKIAVANWKNVRRFNNENQ